MRQFFTNNITVALLDVACIIDTAALIAPPSTALAQNYAGPRIQAPKELTVSSAAFSALTLDSPRTFDVVDVGGFHTAIVQFVHVWSDATNITMVCVESPDQVVWYKVPEVVMTTHPTVLHKQRIWSWITDGASGNSFFEVPMRFRYLQCTLDGTSATISDLLSASMYLSD